MRTNIGFKIEAGAEVQYGPLRLAVAEWAGKSPADVTGDDVAHYEAANEEGQGRG